MKNSHRKEKDSAPVRVFYITGLNTRRINQAIKNKEGDEALQNCPGIYIIIGFVKEGSSLSETGY